MHSTRNPLFENVWALPIDLMNKQIIAAIDLQLWLVEILSDLRIYRTHRFQTQPRDRDSGLESVRMAACESDRLGSLANAPRAASELDDRIEIWVNEGGAGGEVDR